MSTYAIAYDQRLSILYACVPDDIDPIAEARRTWEAVASEEDLEPKFVVERGLTLTDYPEDQDLIIFEAGSRTGYLLDKEGMAFRYAVTRRDFPPRRRPPRRPL